ncbi:MAG: LamG-like jellyroll fold domain-containing protein [Myxococcales bacterium]
MMRLGLGLSVAGVLLFAVACSDDAGTPTPGTGTGGGAGTATTAGTSPGGSASAGSAAGGVAGTSTAGTSTGGSSSSGSSTGGSAGSGTAGGSAGSAMGGSGGAAGGSGGGAMGGSAGSGGGACDATTGKALQFKGGVNDLVAGDLGNDLMGGNSARTVELWAHFTSDNSWKAEGTMIELGRKTNAANQVFGIDMAGRTDANTGKFDPYTNGIGDNDPTPVMLPSTTWAHLAWAYDGAGHFAFFANGTKVTLPHAGDGSGMLATTKGIVTLGGSQGFGYEGWDGVMDEVRVWSVFRAEADIKRDMKVKLKGTETGLVAYYNLDEGTGETADDIKKTASHQLKFCTANGGACPVQNAAKPMWVASDIPGPFTCAP